MTSTTKAAVKQKTCKNPACKKRFRPSVATAMFCTRTCKDKCSNKSRRKDPIEKAMKCAFFYYLAGECLRAGTLEILRGHTVETLSALHSLYKANMRYNGYGDVNDYELSHIHPVKGSHDNIGLLFADNLVSAPKALNRAHGTKYFDHGLFISRATLDTKHAVGKIEKESEVVARLLAYIGKTVVAETIKQCKIKPAQRCQLTQWIANHYDETNPEHVAALPNIDMLDTLKTKALQNIKTLMTGKDASGYFKCNAASVPVVMIRELSRLSEARPELAVYAYALEDALTTQRNASLFTEHHAKMIFDVLHGKSIAVMADTLEMIIAENTVHILETTTTHNRNGMVWATNDRTTLAAFKASVAAPTRATTTFEDFAMMRGAVVPVAMNLDSDTPW
jgi:hypothetical protein